MMRRVVTSELDEAKQFLLVNIIETYFELSDAQSERYRQLIARKEYRKVQDVDLTWMDKLLREGEEKGVKAGVLKGKRETLLRLLAQKYGSLPERVTARVEVMDSKEELDACLERILMVNSLEEMGLDT